MLKTAIITGATAGIGEATAIEFAKLVTTSSSQEEEKNAFKNCNQN
jgi:NAD(P)-dependent dehydrogenase (short-subunit alcohol dehydrogenase family)